MALGKSYNFHGSHLRISTGYGTPLTITGVTTDEPALVTAANTLALGDVVKIRDAMAGLNDQVYAIDNPDANGFELAGTNTTNYPAFVLGNPNNAQALPAVFTDFCELTGVTNTGGTKDQTEVTTICSTAKEFKVGLADTGSLSFDFNFVPNSPIQVALRNSQRATTDNVIAVQIVFPEGGGTIVAFGYVTDSSWAASNGTVWTGSASIKLTGELMVFEAA